MSVNTETPPGRAPKGRAPRRRTDEDGSKRVFWNGGPVDEGGNVIPDPEVVAEQEAADAADRVAATLAEQEAAADDEDEANTPEEEAAVRRALGDVGEATAGAPHSPGADAVAEQPPELDAPELGAFARAARERPDLAPEMTPELGYDIPMSRAVPAAGKERSKMLNDNLDQFMGQFDFDSNEFYVVLLREKPQLHNGEDCTGWLGKYDRPLPTEEVNSMHGGGGYRWMIYGPNPKFNGKVTLIANKSFKIAGKPIFKGDQDATRTSENNLVKEVILGKERDVQRMQKEVDETRRMLIARQATQGTDLQALVATVAQTVTAASNPAGMREALLEERKITEARLAQEREDRKAAAAAEERRHKESLEAMRLAHEVEMKRIERENDRIAEDTRERAKEKENSASTMMLMMQKMQSDSLAAQQRMQSDLMLALKDISGAAEKKGMEAQKYLFDQMQSAKELESTILMKALDRAESRKEGSFEKVIMAKMLDKFMDDAGLGEPEEKSVAREVLDGVQSFASPLLSQWMTSRAAQAQAPVAQPGPPLPGSVAIVDLPPQQLQRRPRHAPGPRRVKSAMDILSPAKPAPPPPGAAEWAPVFPADADSPEVMIKILVADIEDALKHDWETKQIWDQIVSKFPPAVIGILKAAGIEKSMEVVNATAPADWIIRTPRGAKLLDELHVIMGSVR